eukprot:Unigene3456_Nuclearia_a/m.10580 Unigene3456_Nuclearia_a/g.10580  ORF Unigene3456_Nuclearia_a/g.10580 Unigene3456_Nuclearia_a/m.10580 type:complete len:453 (+) Unigene3456_Nuclearia_a:1694-3052(+)
MGHSDLGERVLVDVWVRKHELGELLVHGRDVDDLLLGAGLADAVVDELDQTVDGGRAARDRELPRVVVERERDAILVLQRVERRARQLELVATDAARDGQLPGDEVVRDSLQQRRGVTQVVLVLLEREEDDLVLAKAVTEARRGDLERRYRRVPVAACVRGRVAVAVAAVAVARVVAVRSNTRARRAGLAGIRSRAVVDAVEDELALGGDGLDEALDGPLVVADRHGEVHAFFEQRFELLSRLLDAVQLAVEAHDQGRIVRHRCLRRASRRGYAAAPPSSAAAAPSARCMSAAAGMPARRVALDAEVHAHVAVASQLREPRAGRDLAVCDEVLVRAVLDLDVLGAALHLGQQLNDLREHDLGRGAAAADELDGGADERGVRLRALAQCRRWSRVGALRVAALDDEPDGMAIDEPRLGVAALGQLIAERRQSRGRVLLPLEVEDARHPLRVVL